jgi:hypothetical protein
VAEFFVTRGPDVPGLSRPAEKALAFFHLGTGLWLRHLVFAVVLNFVLKYTLPLVGGRPVLCHETISGIVPYTVLSTKHGIV